VAVIPIAPPRNPPPQPELTPADPASGGSHDPVHDPHHAPTSSLPVSVLIGLALVPFGIPLLWFVAPFVTGQEAALSLAVPISLAVAASALCLGVVYTIDWTGTTRVKGVLMLVGLAYLTAAGLYFLKKDLVDRVQRFGGAPVRWNDVPLDRGKCTVRMPGHVWPEDRQPLKGLAQMGEVRRAEVVVDPQDGPRYEYQIAVGRPTDAAKRDEWFERVGAQLKGAGGKLIEGPDPKELKGDPGAGRQWTFKLDDNNYRIVRVFLLKDRVYYLSAEGPNLTATDPEHGQQFFETLFVK
jgi:hypothetical protein